MQQHITHNRQLIFENLDDGKAMSVSAVFLAFSVRATEGHRHNQSMGFHDTVRVVSGGASLSTSHPSLAMVQVPPWEWEASARF